MHFAKILNNLDRTQKPPAGFFPGPNGPQSPMGPTNIRIWYHILSNCSSGTNVLDIQNYYARPCEGTSCYWTSDKCFKTLYPDK